MVFPTPTVTGQNVHTKTTPKDGPGYQLSSQEIVKFLISKISFESICKTFIIINFTGYNIYVSNENFSSQLEAHVDAGANNAQIILCEEFYQLPYGVWRPGYTYPCNDQLQILTSARYTNQGRSNCYFKDYHVTCNEFTVLFDGYIARAIQEGTLKWDSATIPYEYSSNDGKKWDTAISVGTATFAEAAQICASQGGQLFQEEVDLWGSITDCGAYIEASTKAHGRLFQIPKLEDGISSQVNNNKSIYYNLYSIVTVT